MYVTYSNCNLKMNQSAKHQEGRTQFSLNQSRYTWYLTWRPEFKSHSDALGLSDLTGKCHYCCIHIALYFVQPANYTIAFPPHPLERGGFLGLQGLLS